MNKYELTVVLDGKATTAKKKGVQEFVEKLVAEVKGKVAEFKDAGKKDLAYMIGRRRALKQEGSMSGVFLEYSLELNPESVKEVSEKVKLKEGVIRYLLLRK